MTASQLPERYGHTDLVLMVVHPLLLFAYWEVTPDALRHAHDVLGAEMEGARTIIRMYDISLIHFDGTNAHHVFDIDVGMEAPGWYVHLWTAEKSYVADLGFLARTGRFHAVTRSNVIQTPRTGPSHRSDEQWMRVAFMRRRKPDRSRSLEYVTRRKLSDEELRLRREREQREQAAALLGSLAPSSKEGFR